MDKNANKTCSYHTFIFPFTWHVPGVSKDDEYKKLKSVFDGNQLWMNTNLKAADDMVGKSDIDDFDEALGFYKQYQYFYPYVRKSMYGYDDDICSNYLLIGSRNNGTYHIIKDKYHYILNINAVRIRIVNTGVALFIMECENRGKDAEGKDQSDIDSIKNINDYGRRITLPFINESYSISADRLVVDIPGIGIFEEDFKRFITDVCKEGDNAKEDITLNHTSDFIKKLLAQGSGYRFVSNNPKRKNEIRIFPALDDRMYVAFAAYEKDFIDKVSATDEKGDYGYKNDKRIMQSIYELAFTDYAGSCSCPDNKMCSELVDAALYKRWIPYGTIYTISAMGMGMISNAGIGGKDNYLYENYIMCYSEMVYIAIIQRASIVKFNRETASIARHFAGSSRKLDRKDIRDIMTLQERHTAFESQLYFSEVSSEQQAIEMYDMLKGAFQLEAEDRKLDENLTSLYEITNVDLNISVNTSVGILTWVSIILSAGALLYSILFASDVIIRDENYTVFPLNAKSMNPEQWQFLIILFLLSVLAGVVVRIYNRRK